MNKILVLQFRQLGDVILMTPVLDALRATWPGATVDVCVEALGAQAISADPRVAGILRAPLNWREALTVGRAVRNEGYDLVVDFQGSGRSALVAWLSRAPMRLGWARRLRRFAYTHAVSLNQVESVAGPYSASHKLGLLRAADMVDVLPIPHVVLTNDDRKFAVQFMAGNKLDNGFVMLSPVSKHVRNRWPAAHWAALADTLVDADHQVVVSGGPGEDAQVDAVIEAMKRKGVRLCGGTSVREFAGVIERAALFCAGDNGPRHLAGALGVATVGIFRATTGKHWVTPQVTSQHNVGTSIPEGCPFPRHGSRACRTCPIDFRCLVELSPDTVATVALAALGGSQ